MAGIRSKNPMASVRKPGRRRQKPATSSKALFLCVEVGDSASQAKMVSLLESLGYVIEDMPGCNLIARSTNPKFDQYRVKPS